MKTIKSIIIFALTLIFITSCENNSNVKINTIINEDGSCQRSVSYQAIMSQELRDSLWGKGNIGWALPIPESVSVDKMHNSHTEINGDTVTTTFSEEYASVEDMHKNTPIKLNGKVLKSKVHFEKKNKFFYTEYHYSETFESLKEQLPVSPDQIGGVDTVSYWFTGSPNIMVDEYGNNLPGAEIAERCNKIYEKAEKWVNNNIVEVVFTTIIENYDSIKNPPLSKKEFIASRDSFIKYTMENSDINLVDNDEKVFHDLYKTDAYDIFFDEEKPYYKIVESRFEELFNICNMNIPYNITMPGYVCAGKDIIIREGDAKNGTGRFFIKGEKLLAGDHEIAISTRVINTWAFVVTGLIILIAIGSFVYARKKNSNKK